MTRDEAKSRLIQVKGQKLHERALTSIQHRRGENYVEVELDHEATEYNTFFDFEEDLASVESAREQAEKAKFLEMFTQMEAETNATSFFEMEEEPDFTTAITLIEPESNSKTEEPIIEPPPTETKPAEIPTQSIQTIEEPPEIPPSVPVGEAKYTQVKGFEFKYCAFIKKNGERCKRQTATNQKFCKTHRPA